MGEWHPLKLMRMDPAAVPRDPIVTPLLLWAGADLAFFGTGLTIAGISASTIGSALLTTALVAGANYTLALINKPKGGSGIGEASGINAPEARGNIQQSSPTQRILYGISRVGGAINFHDDSKPPALMIQFLMSARPISGVIAAHIGTNDIQFPQFGWNQIVAPVAVADQIYVKPNGQSRLFMCFRNGDPNQTIDALIAANYPNVASTFRQRGTSTFSMKALYGDNRDEFEKMWGQVSLPNPLIDVMGASVYDPREPNQRYPLDWRDKADVADAMSTWRFSRNASLIQADWLGYPDGVNYPPGKIRWDEIARSAEFDDEPVQNKDGTYRPRHTIDGMVTLDQNPKTILEAMQTANRSFKVESQGYGWMQSSYPRKPVMTIDDSMLLGGFDFAPYRDKADMVNIVRSKFSSSDREFQDIDGPVYRNQDLIEEDGEELAKSLNFPFTSDHRSVQQLTKQYVDENRLGGALTIPLKQRAIADGLDAGRCVRVFSRLPYGILINGLYTVEKMDQMEGFSGLQVQLAKYDPNVAIDWNAARDEQDFTLPPINVS